MLGEILLSYAIFVFIKCKHLIKCLIREAELCACINRAFLIHLYVPSKILSEKQIGFIESYELEKLIDIFLFILKSIRL